MRAMIMTLASVALTGCLVGCGSSSGGGGTSPALTSPVDSGAVATDDTNVPVAAPSDTPAPVASPSNIVDNYDTATCADWAVTDASDRQIVATYFLVRAKADDLTRFETAFETAITVACKSHPDVTVARVAQLSIPTLRQVISQAAGGGS